MRERRVLSSAQRHPGNGEGHQQVAFDRGEPAMAMNSRGIGCRMLGDLGEACLASCEACDAFVDQAGEDALEVLGAGQPCLLKCG